MSKDLYGKEQVEGGPLQVPDETRKSLFNDPSTPSSEVESVQDAETRAGWESYHTREREKAEQQAAIDRHNAEVRQRQFAAYRARQDLYSRLSALMEQEQLYIAPVKRFETYKHEFSKLEAEYNYRRNLLAEMERVLPEQRRILAECQAKIRPMLAEYNSTKQTGDVS